MTAFALRLASAAFGTSLKGLRLPSRKKLVGEYVLGVSQAESVKNRANPALPLTVQGVPTYNAHSVTVRSSFTAGYGFQTGIVPADDATIIAVRTYSVIDTAMTAIGAKIPSFGEMYGMTQFNGTCGRNGENSLVTGANRGYPPAASVFFEAVALSRQNAQLTTGGLGKLYYYTAGVQQVATASAQNVGDRRTIPQICIGSNALDDTSTTNNFDAYFVAIYQRPLSSAEIDAAKSALTSFYAALGITVV